jgi:proton-translocating NADH-quinone oxidoreductase chain N
MPLVFVLIPLVALLVINLPLGSLGKRLGFPVAALLALLQIGAVLLAPGSWQTVSSLFGGSVRFEFSADRLSLLLLLSIGLASLASSCVAQALVDSEDKPRFFNLAILAMVGMNGVSLVTDLFSLYVFLEITAVSSYVLIGFGKDKEGLEGSFKYLILSAIATVMMLASIGLFVLLGGDTSFAGVAQAVSGAGSGSAPQWVGLLAIGLFTAGLLVKGGLVPFHGWVPDAYSAAPAPVSVLLGGIVTKTTGVYTLIRLSGAVFNNAFHLNIVFLVVGILTVVVGALAAMWQKDMKRMLAYSSISQVGYIVLALGAASPLGAAAAAFHLFNHAIFKGQLFINAAAVEKQTGTRDMDQLGGLSERMPITSWTSVVAFLSAAGIPPLAGFWSKLLIVVALWKAGQAGFAVAAIVASVLTLAYFLMLQRKVFFGKLVERFGSLKEASAWLVVPALILAIISIGVGILFPLLMDSIIVPIAGI